MIDLEGIDLIYVIVLPIWSYGLMVMTADFESASLGSIPSRTFKIIKTTSHIQYFNSI